LRVLNPEKYAHTAAIRGLRATAGPRSVSGGTGAHHKTAGRNLVARRALVRRGADSRRDVSVSPRFEQHVRHRHDARAEAFRIHSPPVIFYMLGALTLSCALFAGYEMALRKRRNLLHSISFAVVLAVTVYVIVDLEYPRAGLIQSRTPIRCSSNCARAWSSASRG
jgi:hypothetical protein